ncbi:uncharacterized protein [Triticum aestivum]|uniref:uncharacterized protein isoform X1 n=1 Tax=Triticum aestivum TaxID=4565 RepID=UPI001D018F62|nr:uncharacterized protein LOC123091165 isoform X1 [Triticum aestivum]
MAPCRCRGVAHASFPTAPPSSSLVIVAACYSPQPPLVLLGRIWRWLVGPRARGRDGEGQKNERPDGGARDRGSWKCTVSFTDHPVVGARGNAPVAMGLSCIGGGGGWRQGTGPGRRQGWLRMWSAVEGGSPTRAAGARSSRRFRFMASHGM